MSDDNVHVQDSVQMIEKLIRLGKTRYFETMLPSTAQDLLDTCHVLNRVAVDSLTGQVLVVDDVVSTGRGCRSAGASAGRLQVLLERMRTDPIVLRDLSSDSYRPSGRLARLGDSGPELHVPRLPSSGH